MEMAFIPPREDLVPMTLFKNISRYAQRAKLDERENRLTEITAEVLRRSPLLRHALVQLAVEKTPHGGASADGDRRFLSLLEASTKQADLRHAEVRTQVPTKGRGFVDLELTLAPSAAQLSRGVRLWLEVKHGANLHGDQLATYDRDIALEAGSNGIVVVLAPRGGVPDGVPPGMPVVLWQDLAERARVISRRDDLDEVEHFLIDEYSDYLSEEGLMDPEQLTAEHAFVLQALPETEDALANLLEGVDQRLVEDWGPRGDCLGGKNPAFQTDYWSHFPRQRLGTEDASTWRSVTFEWLVTTDESRDKGSYTTVLCACATAIRTRDSPFTEEANAEWLDVHRANGFELVKDHGWWRLGRFLYPEELLGERSLEAQVSRLSSWVLSTFEDLTDAPPPH